MNNHQLINQSSGNIEYFTPIPIIEAARRVMGRIDLDPASSLKANERVCATDIFTKTEDGLKQDWFGHVWVNHPFGRIQNPLWVRKMLHEYNRMEVLSITCITFAATSEEWFQPLMDFPKCWLTPRTNYLRPDGTLMKGVSKGSVVSYLGPDMKKFAEEFRIFGAVTVPFQ